MSDLPAISFTDIKLPKAGVLVVLAEEGPALSPSAAALDKASGGVLTRAIKINDFKGKKKTLVDLLAPAGLELSRLLVVGVGKLKDFGEQDWRLLGGFIRGRLTGREGNQATLVVEGAARKGAQKGRSGAIEPDHVADLAQGLLLRSYRFDKYKSKAAKAKKDEDNADDRKLARVTVMCAQADRARKAFAARQAVADGIVLARDLTNEPSNILGPAEFAERLKSLKSLGVTVQTLDAAAMRRLKMNALLAVGQGSARPSFLVVMRWNGTGKAGGSPIAIVGKGVTFDTGGISMKPAAGMEDMKGDMAGASCVAGLMHALAARKAKVNAVGIVGLVENMPSGTAQRPGDVVTAMSGTTIEVINTDAEGRLVLADALWYAQEKFKPAAIVNLATLTGAIIVALGKEHAGLFSNNDQLSERLTAAGKTTGEKVWRLPLDPKYDELIKSDVADIKNVGGRWGGSITAAQFLQRFVKDGVAWAHLDIAGTSMAAPKTDISQSWGSGFGVALLDRLIANHYER